MQFNQETTPTPAETQSSYPIEREESATATALLERDTAVKTEEQMSETTILLEPQVAEPIELPTIVEEEEYIPNRKRGVRYGLYLFFKRAFDIVSSLAAILLSSPVLIVALAVKFFEDFHNPIYVSERIGKNGKPFKFYKIRTMCKNADQMKDQLIKEGKNEVDGPAFKIKDDPRITKFGKLLRKTSIDELPQLFNILFGSMSVVGPRSPLPREVEKYTPYQMHRLDVKGGLLCLWQIAPNRHDMSFDEWVKLDLEYIEKQSFFYDMKIIFLGAFKIISGKLGD